MSERDKVVPFPFGMAINSGKHWSDMDDNDLILFNGLGWSIKDMAEYLCRTEDEVVKRLEELKPKAG
jgi:hypothetical protein